jgi:hypothetical protein
MTILSADQILSLSREQALACVARQQRLLALHDREFDRVEFGDSGDGPCRNAVDDAVTRARESDRGVRAALGLEGGS